jgi:ubiquinone/menaquinone biosynthesis C-methylase UbiE
VARHVRLSELLAGVEGLALLRHLYDGTDAAARRRVTELRAVLDDDALNASQPIRELTVQAGYGAWAETYEEPGNPIIALEQPAVWNLVDSLAPGRALDAACGTGRHARHLVERGHAVLGIDCTPEMVKRAKAAVPSAMFLDGDLTAIPAADAEADLVVCALALSHLAELDGGVGELARVLAPGGHLIISVLHPFLALLGWQAPFATAAGERAFIREHAHAHSDYLAAFRASRLKLLDCLELELTAEQVRDKRRAFQYAPEAVTEAYVGVPGVLIWHVRKPG